MDLNAERVDDVPNRNASDVHETDERIDRARNLESLVTQEQVLSASVARKRRNIAKKRSSSAAPHRDQTPCREPNGTDRYTVDDDDDETTEKTTLPERPRRKVYRNASDKLGATGVEIAEITAEDANRASSLPRDLTERPKKRSLTEITQQEVVAFLQKAKKTISNTTERRRRKEKLLNVKRSQSAPNDYEDDVPYATNGRDYLKPIDAREPRRYSSDSCYSGDEAFKNKPYRAEVKEFVAKRRRQRQSSEKIVQILDPKTRAVLTTKGTSNLKFTFWNFVGVLRYVTIKDVIGEYRSHKIDMKIECDRIRNLRNRCIGELIGMMILCGLGAFVFKFTEGAFENFYKCGVKRVKRDFIDHLWTKSHNLREDEWKSLARNKLRTFEEELHTAHEAGMHTYSGQRSWSFLNAVVYCLTIITTIGYGHMFPTTTTGQALTIAYSIVGIPLFLIILTDFGKLFTRCIKFLWSFVRRVYYTGSCRKVRKTAGVQDFMKGAQMMYEIATFRRPSMFVDPESVPADEASDKVGGSVGADTNTPTTPAPSNFEIDEEFNLPISVAMFLLVAYIFSGAVIYCYWEGWNFFSSFYFVFISMSTIGFGDYVPRHPICMIVSIVYLVFGLALMSMCINVVQAKLSDTFRDASAKLGATIGIKVADEDGSIATVPPASVEVPDVHSTPSIKE